MKVLASDYDGTLLFNEKFKEGDLKKIKEFQKAGNLFGLCSGRPFKGIYEFCKPYIDFDFYILCTGALVLNKEREVIYKSTISKHLLHEFYDRYQKDYDIFIQANMQIYTFLKEDLGSMVRQVITSLDEVEGDIYGLSMNAKTDENAKKVCLDIEEHFPELTAHQNKEYIDITEMEKDSNCLKEQLNNLQIDLNKQKAKLITIRNTIENIMKLNVERVVYISCNPATMVRDLKMMEEKYEIKEVQPVDMFPFTSHVETIMVLTLKNQGL